jgi:hypothetical protein
MRKDKDKTNKNKKSNGQSSHTLEKRPDLLQNYLRTQMWRLHSLPTTQLKNA